MKVCEFIKSEGFKTATFVLAYGVDQGVVDIADPVVQNLEIIETAGAELGCLSLRLPIAKSVPDGYTPIKGALSAPTGYCWYSNNVSRFGDNAKDRVSIIVKEARG